MRFWIGITGGVVALLLWLDLHWRGWLNSLDLAGEKLAEQQSANARWWFEHVLSAAGHWWVLFLATATIVAWLLWQNWHRGAIVFATATTATQLAVWLLKESIGRIRPTELASGYAFPSGHVTGAAFACMAGGWLIIVAGGRHDRIGAKASWLTITTIVCLLTAAGRIMAGVHWITDTMAAIGLAMLLAALTAWAAGPTPSNGGTDSGHQ